MFAINVMLMRWVSDDQPGIVECQLIDRFGKVWRFTEKLPVVSTQPLCGADSYPQPGIVACQVIERGRDVSGREVAEIDTGTPWGVETIEGTTRFHVFMDQLVELSGR